MSIFNENTRQLSNETDLPHNRMVEKFILSSLLISSEALEVIFRNVRVETFYFKNHQELFKTIIEMSNNQISIEILTLKTSLENNGKLNQIGGIKTLVDLVNHVPNLLYLEQYINILQDKFLRRCIIKLGYEIINSAYITNISPEKVLNILEFTILKLTNGNNTQKLLNSAELFSNVYLELKQKSTNSILSGINSGFHDLDSFTQGFQKSDLIVIAGRPSMGKTALSLNIGLNICKNLNLPVLFFSLEMSKEQLTYRLLTHETTIPSTRLKTGNLYQQDWVILNNTIQKLSALPLFIDDTPNPSIQDIKSKIKKVIFEQNQIGLIIIDYLQLMQNPKFSISNRTQELSQITRSLKNLAREYQVPIIALSQLSRNVENRINKRPILSDLRESGSIEQDADLVLMLYRESYYTFNALPSLEKENNLVELIIAKQRNGPIGIVELEFDSKCTKFLNINSNK